MPQPIRDSSIIAVTSGDLHVCMLLEQHHHHNQPPACIYICSICAT